MEGLVSTGPLEVNNGNVHGNQRRNSSDRPRRSVDRMCLCWLFDTVTADIRSVLTGEYSGEPRTHTCFFRWSREASSNTARSWHSVRKSFHECTLAMRQRIVSRSYLATERAFLVDGRLHLLCVFVASLSKFVLPPLIYSSRITLASRFVRS